MRGRCIFALLALLLVTAQAQAAASATIVDSTQLVSTKINYKTGSRTKSTVIYCLGKTPGSAKSVPGGVLFTPIATTIAQLKARHISGTKLNSKIAIKKSGTAACTKLGRPSPTPTPVPPLTGANFDANGNLTAKGKVTFGVPAGVSGNISSGRSLTGSYCTCHGERIGRDFPTLRTAIAQPPMSFDSSQITDSMLADITAYLNRFNL